MATFYRTPAQFLKTAQGELKILWNDHSFTIISPRELRLACPCAHCVEEFTGKPLLQAENIPLNIKPLTLRNIGRYALTCEWSDSHRTGIYSYDYIQKRFGVVTQN